MSYCWHPIEISEEKKPGETHCCSNPTCPLSSLKVRVKIFSDFKNARQARKQEGNVFKIGEITRFSDINDNPVNCWGYFFCDERIGRFRLLDGNPLEKLITKSFVANWEYGVSTRTKKPFTIFLVEYEKDTGAYRRDSDEPYITAVQPQAEGMRAPVPVSYCDVCKKVREEIVKLKDENEDFVDPCMRSNRKLVKALFEEGQIDHRQLRLAVADPERAVVKLFDKLHHTCWLGLQDMAYPVMVADVIIAVVFTGQIRIRGMELSEAQRKYRKKILDKLGLEESDIEALIEKAPEFSEKEARTKFWNQLRKSAHELQTIAAGRYGQMGALRGALINQKLCDLTKSSEIQSSTKEIILAETGYEAIKELGLFFSFWRAAIFIKESGKWKCAANWTKNVKPTTKDSILAQEIELSKDSPDIPNTSTTKKVTQLLWPAYSFDKNSTFCWINGDDDTWYFFADRRFSAGNIRRRFNRFSRHLLYDATLSFHREMITQFVTYQQLENIGHIIHNLIAPSAILESSLASFDAETYQKHYNEMALVSNQFGFLGRAIDELYSDIEKCRRRIAFEIRKFQKGLNINRELRKKKRKISIFDSECTPKGEPKGFWDKTKWAFDMYSGEMQRRNVTLVFQAKQKGFINKCVRIHPDNLQIVIENIIDNAVKYAYEDSESTVTIYLEELEGEQSYCTLRITNYGNGVLESEYGKIWQFGVRGQCSTTSKLEVAGTGLGLFTVKKIIEHYEGKVSLESHFGRDINYKRGEGFKTTVKISLPIHEK